MNNLTFDEFRKKYSLLVGPQINTVGGAKIFKIDLPDRVVAIKKTECRDANLMEVNIHRKLSHICQDFVPIFLDSCTTPKFVYIAMELCTFGSLYEFSKKTFEKGFRELPSSEFAEILLQMLQCIDFLHSNNIVHRDIKPDNFLIDEFGKIKLCDFGYAVPVDKILREFCGTCDYIAPEIVAQIASVTFPIAGKECDVWSFGISAYELAYATTPWDEKEYGKIDKITLEIGKLAFRNDLLFFEMQKKDITELDNLLKDVLAIDRSKRPTVAQLLQERPHFLQNYLHKDFYFLKQFVKTIKN